MISTTVVNSPALTDPRCHQYAFERDAVGNLIIPGNTFGGTQDVRVHITPQNKILVEVVAFIMAVTGKSRNDSCEVWRNFNDETKKLIQDDLNDDKVTVTFKEKRGNRVQNTPHTQVCSLKKGIFLLTMKLRGSNADRLCMEMADKVGRYLAGDESLIAEIRANARSHLPVHQVMRETLAEPQPAIASGEQLQLAIKSAFASEVSSLEAEFRKRRRYELYDAKTSEMRKEKEAKRQIRILESQALLEAETTKQVQFKEQTRQAEEQTKQAQETTKQMLAQLQLLQLQRQAPAPQAAPVVPDYSDVLVSERELQASLPVGWKGPVTVCRVAAFYNLLDNIPKSMHKDVLRDVGKAILREPYQVFPSGPKAHSLSGNFLVNQYSPMDLQDIRTVLEKCSEDTKARLKNITNNTPSVESYFTKT